MSNILFIRGEGSHMKINITPESVKKCRDLFHICMETNSDSRDEVLGFYEDYLGEQLDLDENGYVRNHDDQEKMMMSFMATMLYLDNYDDLSNNHGIVGLLLRSECNVDDDETHYRLAFTNIIKDMSPNEFVSENELYLFASIKPIFDGNTNTLNKLFKNQSPFYDKVVEGFDEAKKEMKK